MAIVTVYAKIAVDVPARLVDRAAEIIGSNIEYGSFRYGLEEAFSAADVPMEIDTLRALAPDEVSS